METLKVRVSYRSLYSILKKNYYCNTPKKKSATNAIFNNAIIPFHGNQDVLWLWQIFCGVSVWISVSASVAESHQPFSEQLHPLSASVGKYKSLTQHPVTWETYVCVCVFKNLLISSSSAIHWFMKTTLGGSCVCEGGGGWCNEEQRQWEAEKLNEWLSSMH